MADWQGARFPVHALRLSCWPFRLAGLLYPIAHLPKSRSLSNSPPSRHPTAPLAGDHRLGASQLGPWPLPLALFGTRNPPYLPPHRTVPAASGPSFPPPPSACCTLSQPSRPSNRTTLIGPRLFLQRQHALHAAALRRSCRLSPLLPTAAPTLSGTGSLPCAPLSLADPAASHPLPLSSAVCRAVTSLSTWRHYVPFLPTILIADTPLPVAFCSPVDAVYDLRGGRLVQDTEKCLPPHRWRRPTPFPPSAHIPACRHPPELRAIDSVLEC
ncbi:hypothetical protein B0H19DRAFT_1375386 [Mycena capillaripes]|nr:hypothetical protein B0H19DRAFT_1375386 [Mycena capillaripes]